jgi:hypothetical protein
MSIRRFNVILVLAIVATALYFTGITKAQFVTDGLISYWPLDSMSGDTISDVVGGNDGTIAGDPQIVTGKIGNAMEFDGDGDFVNCGNDASLNLTDGVTIELWMNPTVAGEGGPNVGPACKAESGVDPWSWQLRYNAPGGFMGFQFNANPGGSTWISVQENLSPGQWYHIVGTLDGSDIVCYLNGVEKERAAMTAISGGDSSFFIAQDGWANAFNGMVDEIRIYDRALSSAEVMQNFSVDPTAVLPISKLSITWGEIKLEK